MLKQKLLPAAVATTLLAGAGLAQAQEEKLQEAIVTGDSLVEGFQISGNVALTTDYRFRGISQSDESPAIQGGFDAEFGPGFYVGVWGSSVDFDTNDNSEDGDGNPIVPVEGYDGSLELDGYVGWATDIGDTDFGIDLTYYYYAYPGDDGPDGDYQEFHVKGSWRDLSLGVAYSDDYYAETDEFWYISGDYSFGLFSDMLTIDLHVGYNILDDEGGFLAADEDGKNEDGYTDYSVGVTYSWASVDFTLAYVGTDLDDDDVFGTDWADDTAVFTISKSL
ncbi:TorF family putative porin [bacterium]|nr:TorF family putative porin [bacterium]